MQREKEKTMKLERLDYDWTICKTASLADLDFDKPFYFVSKTDEEISLVCPTMDAPANTIQREDGWRALRIQGVLDFSLTGILAKLSGILAEQQIGIFAVSTYNTDYLLVKKENFARALQLLENAGYQL